MCSKTRGGECGSGAYAAHAAAHGPSAALQVPLTRVGVLVSLEFATHGGV